MIINVFLVAIAIYQIQYTISYFTEANIQERPEIAVSAATKKLHLIVVGQKYSSDNSGNGPTANQKGKKRRIDVRGEKKLKEIHQKQKRSREENSSRKYLKDKSVSDDVKILIQNLLKSRSVLDQRTNKWKRDFVLKHNSRNHKVCMKTSAKIHGILLMLLTKHLNG